MGLKLLFVCTGNTCRSPMAEGLAHKIFGGKVEVSSAGLEAWEGSEASAHAIEVLKELSLDIANHRSRRISAELMEDADWVIPMTQVQADALKCRFPQFAPKIRCLGDWGERKQEVQDPWMGSLTDYRQTAQMIEALLRVLKYQILR